ncbi:unnamed protein product [Rhizophagus irregularis]|uniref:Transposase Tc1-like domain-containing protein n=1 Tax=Rhizophagus irregularis TaxID=588596 RepID=A0A916ECZ4_9GLOM|nr:unnamed protein product [Rhizophagus irregularis]
MSQRRELTEFEREEIIGLWKGGHKQITASSRSRRPPKLTERSIRHLVRTLKEDRQQSLEEMTKKFSESLSISVSPNTIKRTLHFESFFG